MHSNTRRTLRAIILSSATTATAALGIVAAAPQAHAATISVVPGQSIQNAIAAANNGDTIRVYPGAYNENLDFLGKSVTVVSVSGPAATSIDGRGRGPVVRFVNQEPRAATLKGFTLKGGTGDGGEGGGVRIDNASPTIVGNTIRENHACSGSGIAAVASAALITGNVIDANTMVGCFGGTGGGIQVRMAGAVEIRGNTITNNRADSGGGIELFAAGNPVVMNNRIGSNTALQFDGGGIELANVSDAAITQNVVVGNAANAGRGGGVAWVVPQGARGPALLSNTIAANTAVTGPAVYGEGFQAQTSLVDNVLAADAGLAMVCGAFGGQDPTFRGNDVWSPNAGWDPGCGAQLNLFGNVSRNPTFANAAQGDFHLAAASPLIDAGVNVGALPARDFDNAIRIVDGNANGVATVDIGAYER